MNQYTTIYLVDAVVAKAAKLQTALLGYGYPVIKRFQSPKQALRAILAQRPDLVVIRLSDSGDSPEAQLARRLVALNVGVMLLSAHTDEATYHAAQESNILAYLVAPVHPLTLLSSIRLAEKYLQLSRAGSGTTEVVTSILVKRRDGTHLIRYEDVLYVRANGNSCDLHTPHGRYYTDDSIATLERTLPLADFFRCHRQFIVRLASISALFPNDRLLRVGEHEIPYSRRKSREMHERYHNHQNQ